ncbi:class A sortase (plasmid) [Lactiplantibacillus plantarum]|uniref:Class A sortase n=1 Tax=Lactiplantibacillus plantarum TaxID=1590 RepID=A0AAX1KDR6_LACPN|nr:class A sortase [Lactiplantibacillus plantarum]MCW6127830.1 class A sortase [Lactiplantibacillus plantarum]QAR39264.1 class A sortase [Lactiplantibacillus plantarum]QAR77655.1 class A sortase [Lactiplantibacillus plantarum]QAS31401.1 class A sortase [Lactiplantibacillus plantarum]QQM62479.1 class A sortase [Lactiplantibacillus plantarum]
MKWIKQHQLWSALIGIVSLIVLIGGGIWGWAQYQAHEMTTEYVQTQKRLGRKSNRQLQGQLKQTVSGRTGRVAKASQSQTLPQRYTENNNAGVTNQDYQQLLKTQRKAKKVGLEGQQVAYVKVPSIGLALPIYQGTNQYTLSLGATTYFAHQQMGQGNYVLAGHNMTMPGVLFSNVPQIKMGATVNLISATKVYHYRVNRLLTGQQAVSPNQTYINGQPASTSVLYQQPKQAMVTLFTCNATGSMREVVQGNLTSTSAA